MSTYDNSFSNFGRPLVPVICADSAPRHPQFWRRRFLKVFTIYGHGGHLRQCTVTILAIFRSPTLRRLHMKFEQTWLSSSGELKKNFNAQFNWCADIQMDKQRDEENIIPFCKFLCCQRHSLFDFYFTLLWLCLFVFRFYGPVNPMGLCRVRSVYLTTHLLGRLSPLSG